MCIWVSHDKQFKCVRKPIEGNEYCLFHKPAKASEESALFWRIINFKYSSQHLTDLKSKLYDKQGFNHQISHLIGQELEKIHESNFTEEEKSKPDYEKFKKGIVDLFYASKITGRGNMELPDFKGFIFPKTDILEYRFEYMYNPSTDGTLIFRECIFEGFMNFYGYNFLGNTSFENCDFIGGVIFTKSSFHNNVSFINTNINTAFGIFGYGMFQDTKFLGRKVIFENVKGLLKFDSDFSEKTDFDLINMNYPTDYGTASYGADAYRVAKIQKIRIGDHDGASNYNYLEKCYIGYQILPKPYFWEKSRKGFKKLQFFNYLKDDHVYKKILPKILDLVFKHSIGYGEKPNLALRMLGILIFIFACIYMFIGGISVNHTVINYDFVISKEIFSIENWKYAFRDFGNCLYFSIVTLTTVGYGDLTPSTGLGKFLSGIEMFLGVTFVGAWTATLLRKLIN